MTDTERELVELEVEMSRLCARRDMRVRIAQGEIRQANSDFDKAALPLGRKINKLREKLEASPPPSPPRKPDSDWTPEDQAHFLELSRRESIR